MSFWTMLLPFFHLDTGVLRLWLHSPYSASDVDSGDWIQVFWFKEQGPLGTELSSFLTRHSESDDLLYGKILFILLWMVLYYKI